MTMRYGFIGLGNLGGALAASLKRGGFDLVVHDRDNRAAKPVLAAGAVWAASPRTLAERVDAAITCLPSPQASERVLNGPDGLLSGLKPGSTWIETSTNDADTIQSLAALAAEKGVFTLEAPVTGGVHKAAAGAIAVIVGGEPRSSSGTGRRSRRCADRSFTSDRSAPALRSKSSPTCSPSFICLPPGKP
jgi:3-hydroxyisobutyrate dehydrogenase